MPYSAAALGDGSQGNPVTFALGNPIDRNSNAGLLWKLKMVLKWAQYTRKHHSVSVDRVGEVQL
jgi:hypothetical protein